MALRVSYRGDPLDKKYLDNYSRYCITNSPRQFFSPGAIDTPYVITFAGGEDLVY